MLETPCKMPTQLAFWRRLAAMGPMLRLDQEPTKADDKSCLPFHVQGRRSHLRQFAHIRLCLASKGLVQPSFLPRFLLDVQAR